MIKGAGDVSDVLSCQLQKGQTSLNESTYPSDIQGDEFDEGYYRSFVNTKILIFKNFLHRNSYRLVVICGRSLRIPGGMLVWKDAPENCEDMKIHP